MKQKEFLRLQLSLLKLQYGEQLFLEAVANLHGLTIVDLESRLDEINNIGCARANKLGSGKNTKTSVGVKLEGNSEKEQLIRAIQVRFENKTIFPEMRDVRRFLDRHGQSVGTSTVRGKTFPRLMRVLVDLPIIELKTILDSRPSNEVSGLGVISDEILGRK